jgi:hypothetical protein
MLIINIKSHRCERYQSNHLLSYFMLLYLKLLTYTITLSSPYQYIENNGFNNKSKSYFIIIQGTSFENKFTLGRKNVKTEVCQVSTINLKIHTCMVME